jgi:hypothetical protein
MKTVRRYQPRRLSSKFYSGWEVTFQMYSGWLSFTMQTTVEVSLQNIGICHIWLLKLTPCLHNYTEGLIGLVLKHGHAVFDWIYMGHYSYGSFYFLKYKKALS